MKALNASVWFALGAAGLFGLSTPLAKLLLGSVSPVLLGGLLYLGSGIGLIVARLWRDKGWQATGLQAGEWPWLAGAILFGGVLGPVALMLGLQYTAGSTASLLLNLEAVLTAVLAWVAFQENADRRVVAGMLAIVAGGVILSWQEGGAAQTGLGWGAGLIVLACLCWAIDNNLTRKVSASDALFIAGSKGLVAGCVNVAIAAGLGPPGQRCPRRWERWWWGCWAMGSAWCCLCSRSGGWAPPAPGRISRWRPSSAPWCPCHGWANRSAPDSGRPAG